MNKKFYLTLIMSAALTLTACQDKVASSVDDGSIENASEVETQPAQALVSSDGRIEINTKGDFVDVLAQTEAILKDLPKENVTLLQQDEAQDILIYSANLGKVKEDANAYLSKLSETLKSDTNLNNAQISDIADNRLVYSFSQGSNEELLNESCVNAIVSDDILLTCALSSTESTANLANHLEAINIK